MMDSLEVADRYGQAFYMLVKEQGQKKHGQKKHGQKKHGQKKHGQIDLILQDFRKLQAILKQPIKDQSQISYNFFDLLSSPLLSLKEKTSFIDKVFQTQMDKGNQPGYPHIELSQITLDFLKFLLYKNRIANILDIIKAFQDQYDLSQNRVRGHVFSYLDLTSEEKTQIEVAISKRLQKQVCFEYSKDLSLLGGVLVKVGSLLFDGSLSHQLNLLRQQVTSLTHPTT